jgi:hypothetical protein
MSSYRTAIYLQTDPGASDPSTLTNFILSFLKFGLKKVAQLKALKFQLFF